MIQYNQVWSKMPLSYWTTVYHISSKFQIHHAKILHFIQECVWKAPDCYPGIWKKNMVVFLFHFSLSNNFVRLGFPPPPVMFLWSYTLSKTQSEINWWTGQRLGKKGKMKRLVHNSQTNIVPCLFLQDYYPSTDFFQPSDPRWDIHSPSRSTYVVPPAWINTFFFWRTKCFVFLFSDQWAIERGF